ncbi:MAG TPA: circularly permuted type 2 ATP-grasp protein, partial [Gemmataceae bacterium]|nr:circularly permuted type 2 ATP-grasp protein [Gemmataceae bacterium]
MPSGLSQPPADPDDPAPPPGRPGYQPPAAGYDEAAGPAGTPRPHWSAFYRSLDHLGPTELGRRWREAQHLIRENGVTYNVYGDPRGISRPWQLDPIPLLIAPDDATHLERGLVQRAKLLELVLADLYGHQKLLRDGLMPPELVFPNPGFLRPCHGVKLPGGRFLHLYGANLGRGADGHWRVLGDRTQAPSGAGYTLENRIVMTRTLPEAFRDCRVHRLALFFRTFRDTLRELAPRNRDNPRIVLLTPGPYNETYFEHAYLARYLGYTLVEGGDLTVRDNRVFLKVLGGLQPVDVILRRLDDSYCDPLELRGDSFLGIPGLVQAVRAGNVAVANPLGSGLVEAPALLSF